MFCRINVQWIVDIFRGFGLFLYVSVNSYGHVGANRSPNTFFPGQVDQMVNQYFVQILLIVTDNNPS